MLIHLYLISVISVVLNAQEPCPFNDCFCVQTTARTSYVISCDSTSPVDGFPARSNITNAKDVALFTLNNYRFREFPSRNVSGLPIMSLSISNSNLEIINDSTFDELQTLKQFSLIQANLRTITSNSFAKISGTIEGISLINSGLTDERLEPLWDQIRFSNIAGLSLSGNSLTSLPPITEYSNLGFFDASNQNNNLRRLNDFQFERKSIDRNFYLDLSSNNIVTVSNKTFCSRYTERVGVSTFKINYASFRNINRCVIRQLNSNTSQITTLIDVVAETATPSNGYLDVCNCNLKRFLERYKIILGGVCVNNGELTCAFDSVQNVEDTCDETNDYTCEQIFSSGNSVIRNFNQVFKIAIIYLLIAYIRL